MYYVIDPIPTADGVSVRTYRSQGGALLDARTFPTVEAARAFRFVDGERAQFLSDLFTTALEGGIGYWSEARSYHWTKDGTLDGADLEGFRAEIRETDVDEDEPAKWLVIDRAVIARGIEALATGKCTFGGKPLSANLQAHFAGMDATNGEGVEYDASDADMVVQAGLFGDVVYG